MNIYYNALEKKFTNVQMYQNWEYFGSARTSSLKGDTHESPGGVWGQGGNASFQTGNWDIS